MGALVLAEGAMFEPPGAESFILPPIFGSVTKPMVLVVLSVVIIATYFLLATRKLKLVPGKGQFVAESIYDFSRNNIAREQIGSKDFKRFVPVIFALFTFILVNNLYGIIPVLQFPTMARFGFPIALSVLVVFPVYHYVGIKRHGLGGYFKKELAPPGVPRRGAAAVRADRVRGEVLPQPDHARHPCFRRHVRRSPDPGGVHPRRHVPADRDLRAGS